MPVTPTFPGVYIQEKPSGVRTIVGVATAIAAFVGRAARGPVGAPTTVHSLADYERIFGGLSAGSRTSYAVRDFFLNGGSQAVIVRLFHGDAAHPEKSHGKIAVDNVKLEAVWPGAWGANLRAVVDASAVLPSVATQLGVGADKIFSLEVIDATPGGGRERFDAVTLVDSPRRLDTVLAQSSELVRWQAGQAIGGTTAKPLNAGTRKGDATSEAAAAAATAARDWRTATQALAEAKAGGKTGTDLDPFTSALTAATTARDAAQTAVAAAGTAAAAAIADGPLTLTDDYLPGTPKAGLFALDLVDLFNMLCLPPDTEGDIPPALWDAAAVYCEQRRAMLLVDPPRLWTTPALARQGLDGLMARSRNAAIYFPRLLQLDPIADNQAREFVPSGTMAGIYARTDAERGVWKAPAGIEATIRGSSGLRVPLTDGEIGELNPVGLNCLRELRTIGRVAWGARTLRGADALADEAKYVPVRRLTLFIEESLFRGTKWVVFEPNDEPLWAQIRLNVGAFMNNLFRQGAFQGTTPRDAYLVKCDRESNPQADVDKGIVNILVGFAPLKPAEFVVIKIQQLSPAIDG